LPSTASQVSALIKAVLRCDTVLSDVFLARKK
jgi:hypothetical protein